MACEETQCFACMFHLCILLPMFVFMSTMLIVVNRLTSTLVQSHTGEGGRGVISLPHLPLS